ncbi:class I SAM-dependent methyltransferase [Propioniciclava sinopodophylli]|uniref:class I SAM-dependent methyltransferase n=1 Tax=Propioniciclava sinopodophylli TaxID=1837344 RepID=UPI00248F8065|nr:class I SAM-dependent methyltransferase [Propioniciclava sinopodophylli]
MDLATARWLTSPDAAAALAAATAEPDPGSLAAATRLRALVDPDQAAAVLNQAALRRRASAKFGPRAGSLFLTPDALEQATRAPVAARRAVRFARVTDAVVDLGCGIGADALALVDAGLDVIAVERDPVTAELAAANLGRPVLVGDAEEHWRALASDGVGVFADPARRTASGRTWRVEELSPPWSFVEALLAGDRPACVKLGPGVPHAIIPDHVEAEWVSDGGTVVECALWAGPGATHGRRVAVVDGAELVGPSRLVPRTPGTSSAFTPGTSYLYEPDGAVVRAGLVDEFARLVRAERIADGIAYLVADWDMPTPFATVFRILEVLPYDEKTLRAWVRDQGVGTLEIKKRGIDVDPAELRRRLKPKGRASATLVLTPTPEGARALVCARVD